MIDFVEQIDMRLREFQRLTGKGNIKDCHQILYEIIRLLMALIARSSFHSAIPMVNPSPIAEQPKINAPHGLTRFGNPRRIRKPKNK